MTNSPTSDSTSQSTTDSSSSNPASPSQQPRALTSDDEAFEEEDEEAAAIECPSFVRDRAIARMLHEYEVGFDDQPEPDFTWDTKTISQHLAKYLDDLCGWVPDPKVQYRRVAASSGKKNGGAKPTSRAELEAQVRRLSVTSRAASRMKTIAMEFEFRHYHNPKKYMEQYRRFHTCGGPLEKLATQDMSYGRKRSIYYAGAASAEAGFKPETTPQPQQESRLTAAQLQQTERQDGQRHSTSRARQNSESKSEQSLSKGDGNSVSSRLTSSQLAGSPTEPMTLPRYCTLTEAALRKRHAYSQWPPLSPSKEGAPRAGSSPGSKLSRDSDPHNGSHYPTSLSVTESQATHPVKPQSWSPPGLRPGASAPVINNGFRPTFHNPTTTLATSSAPTSAADESASAVPSTGPPVGQHPFWRPTNLPVTHDNHTLPVAFGLVTRLSKNTLLRAIDEELSEYDGGGTAGNFATGMTLDDSCYGYHSEGGAHSEGSAFRDFYSHLLQAAHYLRLAGRQKSQEKVPRHQSAPRHLNGPALHKSTGKALAVTAPDENFVTGFADPIPTTVAVAHGLGIRGQRMNSATAQRATQSAAPMLLGGVTGGGGGRGGVRGGATTTVTTRGRAYVNAPAFKSAQARYYSTAPAANPHHFNATSNHHPQDFDSPHATSNRKRFISLDPPSPSMFRESSQTKSAGNIGNVVGPGDQEQSGKVLAGSPQSDGRGQRTDQKAGKIYQISISNKPCKATESDHQPAQTNAASLCQAVCFES